MNEFDELWRTLLNDGEARITANLYQRAHLFPLSWMLRSLQRRKVSRGKVLGRLQWDVFEALKRVCGFTSPRSTRLFGFYIEAAWFSRSLERKRIGWNHYEYVFVRKSKIDLKKVDMLLRRRNILGKQ